MAGEKLKMVNFIAFFSVVTGFFMVMLDSTIVNITLPMMIRYFNTDMSTISWVVNGYNLSFAVMLLTGARIADQFGRKRLFLIGMVAFTITSFLAAISQDVNTLIFFRVLQGLAGALMVPVSLPLILNLFPASRSGLVIGIWGAVAGIAAASGPACGGIIGQYLNWQWIFYINIPMGIAAASVIPFVIKESFDQTASRKIDYPGMFAMSAAMFCVTLALIQANDKGWGSPYILSLFAVSLISFGAFYFIEKKEAEPMLPMILFKNIYFCTTSISLVILGAALMCGVFFTAFFLTQVKEFSQLKAGLVITAYPLSTIILSAISGSLSDKFGFRIFAFPGSILICISVWYMSGLTVDSQLSDIIVRLAFCGSAIGLAFPTIVTASVRATPPDKLGMASAVGNVSRTIGAILGVALLVTTVTHYIEKEIVEARSKVPATIMSSTVFTKEVKDTLLSKLTNLNYSKNSRIPTEKEIVSHFEKRRDEAVLKAPPMMRPAIKKVYEQQIEEMSRVYGLVKRSFFEHIAKAFSITYKLSAIVLIIGVVAAFFCEPFRKKRL